MRHRSLISTFAFTVAAVLVVASLCSRAPAQAGNQASQPTALNSGEQQAEAELQNGIALTHSGHFADAIPHLLAAQGKVSDEYAANFDLALCYVATHQFTPALQILTSLRNQGKGQANVENLLAQAYIGNGQPEEAFAALQKAATLTPENEKLYLFVADACMDQKNYSLGLKTVDLGLHSLPQSASLHYERGMFLSMLDEFDIAKADFDLARSLAPGREIAYLAATQKDFLEGDMAATVQGAREAVKKGYESYMLLTILGEALIRTGISPGQPEFAEAQASLEKAVEQRPNYPVSQLALGQIYLMAGNLDAAIVHLELAKQLDPGNPSVYSHLAAAYRRQGKLQDAQKVLAILADLNHAQAEKIRSAPGSRKIGYGEAASSVQQSTHPTK